MTDVVDVCVVGPTASGKTALGVELAQLFGAEVISADAMQVYRQMDIGTAKPSTGEMEAVRHHLIDVVDCSESFTVVDFQARAFIARDVLHAEPSPAVIVGGTGLYVQSYVDELKFPGRFPEAERELEAEADVAVLFSRLEGLDPVAASRMDPNNRRRIVRALEVTIGSGEAFSSFGPGLNAYPARRNVLQVGLELERDVMDDRIEVRLQEQLERGFLSEVAKLAEQLGPTASQALGYKELLAHVRGDCTLEEAIEEALRRTRRFARRQQRWFGRDPRVHWIDASSAVAQQVAEVSALMEESVAERRSIHGTLDG
jgi:tRNA dimethylallyltransferase